MQGWVIRKCYFLDMITHPCPTFNGGLINLFLQLDNGWVIIPHSLICVQLLMHLIYKMLVWQISLCKRLQVISEMYNLHQISGVCHSRWCVSNIRSIKLLTIKQLYIFAKCALDGAGSHLSVVTHVLSHAYMHISVGNLTIIGSDNGLSPGWCQVIIGKNIGIVLIGPLGILV